LSGLLIPSNRRRELFDLSFAFFFDPHSHQSTHAPAQECPFHRWQFNGDGKVTHIPYAEKVPEVAKTRAWPTREYYGHICIYYDAEGRDPPYELDPYPQIDNEQWVYRGVHSETVSMHIQEFAENAVVRRLLLLLLLSFCKLCAWENA
jgi:hypothetical protein